MHELKNKISESKDSMPKKIEQAQKSYEIDNVSNNQYLAFSPLQYKKQNLQEACSVKNIVNKNHSINNNVIQRVSWDKISEYEAPAKIAREFINHKKGALTNSKALEIYNEYTGAEEKKKKEIISSLGQISSIPRYPEADLHVGTGNIYDYQDGGHILVGANKRETIKNIATTIARLKVPKQEHIGSYISKVSPFKIKMVGQVNGNNSKIELMYNFDKDGYGYVDSLKEGAETYTMNQGRGENINGLGDHEYSSAHDKTYDGNLYDLINSNLDEVNNSGGILDNTYNIWKDQPTNSEGKPKDPTGILEGAYKRSTYLDSMTKLGGEGARFKCVREADELRNNTKFCTTDAGKYISVRFDVLWGNWKKWFKCEFDIDNDKIKEVLIKQKKEKENLEQAIAGLQGQMGKEGEIKKKTEKLREIGIEITPNEPTGHHIIL